MLNESPLIGKARVYFFQAGCGFERAAIASIDKFATKGKAL
jgi:hypothetical protein